MVDRSGNDYYYCSGRDQSGYGETGIFQSWGQGCGLGLRHVASGGVAVLVDQAGDDVYKGSNWTQGGGYYFGWGALLDGNGDDKYLGEHYTQAFAAHQAIGFLEDHAGNDLYRAQVGVGQSIAWDETITMLLDHSGNDDYSGGAYGLASASHNSIALLVDYAGQDRYRSHQNAPRMGGNRYHGGTSLALLLDLGNADDIYADDGANNIVRHSSEHGFFIDVPVGFKELLGDFRKWIK